jgi:hypothetical protein
MVSHGMVDLQIVNDLAGGAILGFWSRAKNWSEERRKRTGQNEFLEWCEWLAMQIAQYRAKRPYVPAYSRGSELNCDINESGSTHSGRQTAGRH